MFTSTLPCWNNIEDYPKNWDAFNSAVRQRLNSDTRIFMSRGGAKVQGGVGEWGRGEGEPTPEESGYLLLDKYFFNSPKAFA